MSLRRQFLKAIAAASMTSLLPGQTAKTGMIVRSARPEDLEMPFDGMSTWITPNNRFFVRSHHYTPTVELASWRINVSGEVQNAITLTMDDLRKVRRAEIVSVLECAGNGRGLYEPPMPGVQWTYGAVGNARWTGVRLSDVLAKAGVKPSAKHVLFDGADVPVGTMPEFKRTVPLAKAMAEETLLAFEMNGEPLPISHGFPLRLVVPGWAGDSWTKWVTGIQLLDREFDGFFMKTAYRHPGKPVTPGKAIEPDQMHPVEHIALKCVIAGPSDDSRIAMNPVKIHGVAWSGEAPVTSVEVSTDRGRSWKKAALGRDKDRFAWRLWDLNWTPPRTGHYTLMARAFDARGTAQPFEPEWNPSGYLNNTIQRVSCEVVEKVDAPSASKDDGREGKLTGFDPPKGYASACLTCHNEDITMQQRLSRVQWEREVDKMVRWGAKVPAQDREPIIEYLLKLYGPRPRK